VSREGQRSQRQSNSPADATSEAAAPGTEAAVDGTSGRRRMGEQRGQVKGEPTASWWTAWLEMTRLITQENCGGEARASTPVTSLPTGKDWRAGAGVGAADRSVDLWARITHGEPSGSTYSETAKRAKDPVMALCKQRQPHRRRKFGSCKLP